MLDVHGWLIVRQLPVKCKKLDYRYVKQSGGHGQFGHVVINLEPVERGQGIVFENKTFGGSIPSEYIPAIEKGIREASETGVLAGYPVVDVKVSLVDGSYHEVDSSEMAFKMAGLFAFKEAMQKGAPVLLEPIMKVEVVVAGRISGRYSGSDQFQTWNHSWNGSPPGKCTCCPV